MVENGFYFIKDEFFNRFNDPYLRTNKKEHRPHYYAFKDDKTGLFWVVPLSSRISKYQSIIDKKASQNKPCDILHIAKLDNGKTSAFLIQDIFPITEEYIKRKYTINKNHLILTSEAQAKQIKRKAKKVIAMMRRGVKFTPTQPDVLKIEKELLNDIKQ